MRILQITPHLPPRTCGVGDYTARLAEALEDHHGIKSQFLSPASSSQPKPVGSSPFHRSKRSASHLAATLEQLRSEMDAIIVQYSGYGFDKRGAPLWLVRGLQEFARKHPDIPIRTMFHELYSSGSIATSSFWLGPLQKFVIQRLASMSQSVRTNRNSYADWLKRSGAIRSQEVSTFPVFSNLGESPGTHLPSDRPAVLTIFASAMLSGLNWDRLNDILKTWNLESIQCIGAADTLTNAPSPCDKVKLLGHLPASEVSARLCESRLGFMDYYDGYLAKSGIFAAFCAHGVPVVLSQINHSEMDGIFLGQHYLASGGPPQNSARLDQVSENAAGWYAPHNLRATAASYAQDLQLI